MQRILFSFIFICLVIRFTAAQTPQHRTNTTKIADLLAKTPANDSTQLKKNALDVAELGESGLDELIAMLDKPGDNSRIQNAISGFTYYASQFGREEWRKLAVKSYGGALDKFDNNEILQFLISQLEHVGKDDAIKYLSKFLTNERLSDPSARALAEINSEASRSALLTALPGCKGNVRLSLIQALGYMGYREAVNPIAGMLKFEDFRLRKVALYALSQIADPSSVKLMADAAAKSQYSYDSTEATASYIIYLTKLVENGNVKMAEKEAKKLLERATIAKQVQTRIAALTLLTKIQGAGSITLLTSAMKDKNEQFREAALGTAGSYLTDANIAHWFSTFKQSQTESQAQIIEMFGREKVTTALPLLIQSLKSNSMKVRIAAISAIGVIGGQDALSALLGVVKAGNAEETNVAKISLLSFKAENLTTKVQASLQETPLLRKAALIEILGERGASESFSDILPFMNHSSLKISTAARTALKHIITPPQLSRVFPLLISATDTSEVKALQSIIASGLQRIPDPSERTHRVLSQLKEALQNRKHLFYSILSEIGSAKEGLQIVAGSFNNANDLNRIAILNALSNWKDGLAAGQLADMLQAGYTEYNNQMVDGLIRQISMSLIKDELKLIWLRDAMERTKSNEQRVRILKLVEKCKTYPALIFAGNYLDDPLLKQQAASSVMNIAFADNSFYGVRVRPLLEKCINTISGPDSEYQREAIRKHLANMPKGEGFVSLFNGEDLSGWKGLIADPIKRANMDTKTLATEQVKADDIMRSGWFVKDGVLVFSGKGENLCTQKKYGDFEMYVDWKITKQGDAGVYLRGTPQVQIWDTSRLDVGAQVGSGGLYNNQKNKSTPLTLADNAIGRWNSFHIIMIGDQVTVYLNGQLVVDRIPLENYWDRNVPIFPDEQIELQAHGTFVAFRDIYIREIHRPKPYELTQQEKKEGYKILFDGTNLYNWVGNKTAYVIEDGNIAVYPKRGGDGNLYTKDEYSDFIYRFEFKLTPGANNGIGIRAPLTGDAAYVGMEIQVLDNDAEIYRNLKPYQYHGSVYGVIPAKRGYLKPVGEWNEEEIYVKGNYIRVVLNGTVITEGDIAEASGNGTADHQHHPGLTNVKGHIGFLGHGDVLYFRNVRIRDLIKSN